MDLENIADKGAPDPEQSPEAAILKRLMATFCDFVEAGRTIPGARARLDVLRLLAGISDESLSQIAKRRKLSRQNLHQIAQGASESFGLTLPYQHKRKRHRGKRRKREGVPG
jgi:hypothetical protein